MPEIAHSSETTRSFLPAPIPVTQQHWPDDEPPLLSISCKTYMHENFIREAIEGFLIQQTNFKIEILIHDDASTDKTADIIQEYEKKHPELIIVTYQVENQYRKNPKTSKYVEPPEQKGKYIALCEGDDYWTDPFKLQKQVDFLEANTEFSLSYCRFRTLNEETGEFQNDMNGTYFANGDITISFDFEKFYKGWHMGTQTLVFRKNMFDSYIRTHYKYFRDIHLITHLLLNGKGVCFSFFGAVYRKHKGGIYSGATDMENAKLSYLCYREIYQHNKREHYLKLKYCKFAHFYVDQLLKSSNFTLAAIIAFQLLVFQGNASYLSKIAKFLIKRK